jgi:hypothetical protein
MNYNKEYGLLYWATAGCASRTNLAALDGLGDRWTYYPQNNKLQKFGTFSHNQGIPPGCEDYKIICSIRNPYTRAVSAYIDLLAEGKTFSFKEYCFEYRYNNYPNDRDLFYWNEWQELGVPDYFIRLEHIVKDWESIPQFINNIKDWERLKPNLTTNSYHGEKPLDQYDANGHQKVTRFMDQEVADLIFEKDAIIFKVGQYARTSWK